MSSPFQQKTVIAVVFLFGMILLSAAISYRYGLMSFLRAQVTGSNCSFQAQGSGGANDASPSSCNGNTLFFTDANSQYIHHFGYYAQGSCPTAGQGGYVCDQTCMDRVTVPGDGLWYVRYTSNIPGIANNTPGICVQFCVGSSCAPASSSSMSSSSSSVSSASSSSSSVQCTQNSDCNDGNSCTNDVCSNGVCTFGGYATTCASDNNPCTADTCFFAECQHTPLCNPQSDKPICKVTGGAGSCVQCTDNSQCSGSTPVCNTATNSCVQCTASSQCSGATPVCNTATHLCVACLSNNDCTKDTDCTADVCTNNVCQNGSVAKPEGTACTTPAPNSNPGKCSGGTCFPTNKCAPGAFLRPPDCPDPQAGADQSCMATECCIGTTLKTITPQCNTGLSCQTDPEHPTLKTCQCTLDPGVQCCEDMNDPEKAAKRGPGDSCGHTICKYCHASDTATACVTAVAEQCVTCSGDKSSGPACACSDPANSNCIGSSVCQAGDTGCNTRCGLQRDANGDPIMIQGVQQDIEENCYTLTDGGQRVTRGYWITSDAVSCWTAQATDASPHCIDENSRKGGGSSTGGFGGGFGGGNGGGNGGGGAGGQTGGQTGGGVGGAGGTIAGGIGGGVGGGVGGTISGGIGGTGGTGGGTNGGTGGTGGIGGTNGGIGGTGGTGGSSAASNGVSSGFSSSTQLSQNSSANSSALSQGSVSSSSLHNAASASSSSAFTGFCCLGNFCGGPAVGCSLLNCRACALSSSTGNSASSVVTVSPNSSSSSSASSSSSSSCNLSGFSCFVGTPFCCNGQPACPSCTSATQCQQICLPGSSSSISSTLSSSASSVSVSSSSSVSSGSSSSSSLSSSVSSGSSTSSASQSSSVTNSSSSQASPGYCCLGPFCGGPFMGCTHDSCLACAGTSSATSSVASSIASCLWNSDCRMGETCVNGHCTNGSSSAQFSNPSSQAQSSGGNSSALSASSTSSEWFNNCPVDSCGDGGAAYCASLGNSTCINTTALPCLVCLAGGSSSASGGSSQHSSSSSSSSAVVACVHICGNGLRECNEECDDGNLNNDDGCSSTCLVEGGFCGDGIIESRLGENCEPAITDPSSNCDSTTCTLISSASSLSLHPPICGNGKREGSEECDDGRLNGTTTSLCNSSCQYQHPFCGDGIVEARLHEDCEPSLISPSAPFACSDRCRYIYAASSVSSHAFSSSSETMLAAACTGNECQQGGDDFCHAQNAICGTTQGVPCIICIPRDSQKPAFIPKTFVPTHVTSSRRTATSSASSASSISFMPPIHCGDGVLNAGEQCDDGILNSANPNAFCRPDCTFSRCGDGIVDAPLELCDAGSQNGQPGSACDAFCRTLTPSGAQVLPASLVQLPSVPFTIPFGQTSSSTIAASIFSGSPASQLPPSNPSTGPETLVLMAMGGAAGYAWMRRRRL